MAVCDIDGQAAARAFVEAIRSQDPSGLLCDYSDGLYSLGSVLAGWESARTGGQPVDVAEFMAVS